MLQKFYIRPKFLKLIIKTKMAPKKNVKCYYKTLEVPRNADEAQIKRKFKELALKYHPDKNLDNVVAATEKFRAIKQAYDILSDPKEKQIYDEFKAESSKNCGDFRQYQDDRKYNVGKDGKRVNKYYYFHRMDLSYYYNTSSFRGFSDRDDGFYSVYRQVFKILSEEGVQSTTTPTFGKSSSDYETVVKPFYIYWLQYNAAKNPQSPQETAKRTEEIRELVIFVRKLDRRVTKHLEKLEKLRNKETPTKVDTVPETEIPKIERTEWTRYDAAMEEQMRNLEKELDEQDNKSNKKGKKRK